jgi:anti-sigma regulatory factor (Ser/Thr protein kinase)
VGDVVGHGLHAAATMGRLRTAVRTLADLDLPPEEVLARLDDLLTALARREPSLERACDDITAALAPDGPHDDIALLLARTRVLAPDRVAQWELPPEPSSVREARALVDRRLTRWGLDHLAHGTALIVSELVTNAVRYGGSGPVQLRLLRGESLVCEVTDHSNSSPRIRRAGASEEGGRGLFLVARYSHAWGARYRTRGKTVWAEQPLRESLPLSLEPGAEEDLLLSLYDDPYDR